MSSQFPCFPLIFLHFLRFPCFSIIPPFSLLFPLLSIGFACFSMGFPCFFNGFSSTFLHFLFFFFYGFPCLCIGFPCSPINRSLFSLAVHLAHWFLTCWAKSCCCGCCCYCCCRSSCCSCFSSQPDRRELLDFTRAHLLLSFSSPAPPCPQLFIAVGSAEPQPGPRDRSGQRRA